MRVVAHSTSLRASTRGSALIETSAKLKSALEKYLAGLPDMINLVPPYDLRNVAREKQFLPVVYDMGGFLVIQLTGKIGWIDLSPPHAWKEEADERIVRLAYYAASEKYPELSSLKPERPDIAITCTQCAGKGKIAHSSNAMVCYCGELGWLLPGE